MIDRSIIHIISGNGGNGAISGRHEKYVPRGGPDGGNGGDGGSVYLISDSNVNTLLEYRYRKHYKAGHGGNGKSALKHGKNGKDIFMRVPVGTQVWITETEETLLADLDTDGQKVMVSKGGRGGAGNARFASSTNQFPVLAQAGEAGIGVDLRLELKLLADVGIIGAPNAGKSSLISAVTAARPRIAEYPFTTIEPVLGVVQHRRQDFVMVDIPGLIEGAHEGVGLGHDFLRHVERTRVLIHLIDGNINDPVAEYRKINEELVLFNEELSNKPQIVAVNKIDIPEVGEYIPLLTEVFLEETGADNVFFISAAGRENLDGLLDALVGTLDSLPKPREVNYSQSDMSDLPILRPKPRRIEPKVIKIEEGEFAVVAPDAIRIAGMVDLSLWEAKIQFYRRLQHTGVVKSLEEAGIQIGDTVHIGGIDFEWE